MSPIFPHCLVYGLYWYGPTEQIADPLLRIAVVDDHPLFRQVVIRVLEGWGKPHTVLEADNGVDYEMRSKGTGCINLALVDLRIPGPRSW
jgi:CheY-like chemotaxis protein